MFVYMCICMSIFVHVSICVSVYFCMCMHLHVCMYVCTCVCFCVFICEHVYMQYMHVYVHMWLNACVCVHLCVCVCVHMWGVVLPEQVMNLSVLRCPVSKISIGSQGLGKSQPQTVPLSFHPEIYRIILELLKLWNWYPQWQHSSSQPKLLIFSHFLREEEARLPNWAKEWDDTWVESHGCRQEVAVKVTHRRQDPFPGITWPKHWGFSIFVSKPFSSQSPRRARETYAPQISGTQPFPCGTTKVNYLLCPKGK